MMFCWRGISVGGIEPFSVVENYNILIEIFFSLLARFAFSLTEQLVVKRSNACIAVTVDFEAHVKGRVHN